MARASSKVRPWGKLHTTTIPNPTNNNHEKTGKKADEMQYITIITIRKQMRFIVWFTSSDTQSLPHVSRSVLHDCDMEKNRAPTTEKTQKVSQTRSLRFSNPVLLHFKIPGPCFFCNGTGILQSGTGKLHERTESNGSFVKGHLTGRKLTATQCRYYVDQEVKQEVKNTLPQDLYDHFINPTHKNHQKAGKKRWKMSFYVRKQM